MKLEELTRLAQPLLEAAPAALCILDLSGREVFANRTCRNMRRRSGGDWAEDGAPIRLDGREVGRIVTYHDLSEVARLRTELERMDQKLRTIQARYTFQDIVGKDPKLLQAVKLAKGVAATPATILIQGESGTGKELFAQAIHNASARRGGPFITQNCAALPDTLLESILFGTAKGAFTGAVDSKGLFELADGGTLFLDEINSMPLHLQSKLLRVLQDGSFRSLGARQVKTVDVKIIAAINVEPLQAIRDRQLRQDIYYRLSMMSIRIPPLRERKKDIASFVSRYVSKHNATFHKQVNRISEEVIQCLERYDWPGNVRQLEQVVVYGMSCVEPNQHSLEPRHIRDKLQEMGQAPGPPDPARNAAAPAGQPPLPLRDSVRDYERELICQALNASGGKLVQAAKLLDIPRQTLQRKIQHYEITLNPALGWR